MSAVYLFQIDCARNNDAFFQAAAKQPLVSVFYRGAGFQVGEAPWIPDGVQVDTDESPVRCSLTLLELEERKSEALISCRKYLPEDSTRVLHAFREYLRRKIGECKSTADTRERALTALERLLQQGAPVRVKTACALRSAPFIIIEALPLIDQPNSAHWREAQDHEGQDKAVEGRPCPFQGNHLRLLSIT
jgi:hypothetical protein